MSFHAYVHESDRVYDLHDDHVSDHACDRDCDRDCDCSPPHARCGDGLDRGFPPNGHVSDGGKHAPPHRDDGHRDRDLC